MCGVLLRCHPAHMLGCTAGGVTSILIGVPVTAAVLGVTVAVLEAGRGRLR